jgi:cyclopropane fatty-acyl-phospholipid synthase-like methyltransferase
MDFLQFKNISERFMELVNPFSAEKVLEIGRILSLKISDRVIDFGCGYGELLRLWAEAFSIGGVGIDIREHACDRARKKMARHGLDERIEIVHSNAAEFAFEKDAYDVAACVGATFIWGGYRETIRAMKMAIRPGGNLVIGEASWKRSLMPPQYALSEKFLTEDQLLKTTREEGFDLLSVVRASQDDWDRYESANWRGLLHWLQENPHHSERQEVIDHLHQSQEEYFQYGREYLGWAVYILSPADRAG